MFRRIYFHSGLEGEYCFSEEPVMAEADSPHVATQWGNNIDSPHIITQRITIIIDSPHITTQRITI